MAIDGRANACRGTGFDTRLTVVDRLGEPGIAVDGQAMATDAAVLLDAVIARVPLRPPVTPVHGADLCGHAPRARQPPRTTPKPAVQPARKSAHDWGSVNKLAVETAAADTGASAPAAASTADPF